MMTVVLDTNVLVSAALKPGGLESSVLELVANRRVTLCLSEPVLAEYSEVLRRPKFQLDPPRVESLLRALVGAAVIVQPEHALSVCPDEADNRFLECAEAAQAEYLVTGNLRHFPERWRRTEVVSARELLRIILARSIHPPG